MRHSRVAEHDAIEKHTLGVSRKPGIFARYGTMAIRRKKVKSKTKRISFKTGFFRRDKKRGADSTSANWSGILKVMAVICVLAAAGAGFALLDKYVKQAVSASAKTPSVILKDPPVWVNEPLKAKIYTAATAGVENLTLDDKTARSVRANLQANLAWLDNVKVQTSPDKIFIQADYRKPIALVKLGLRQFYVDAKLVVLDFVVMPHLPIVKVKGLSPIMKIASPGQVWQRDDLAEAVAILVKLDRMDRRVTPDKPLLGEIDRIDVSNYKGREDKRFPHIVLYAKDNTEIIWGAEVGAWAQHFEAKDEEKLARLYNYYKQRGSLLNGAKYINLRDPQGSISLPIDKY